MDKYVLECNNPNFRNTKLYTSNTYIVNFNFHSEMRSRDALFEAISQIPRNDQSELQTKESIDEKIHILASEKPSQGIDYSKWYRLDKKYILVKCQTSSILYLRGNGDVPNKRVVAILDIYDIAKKVHIDQDHPGRTGL